MPADYVTVYAVQGDAMEHSELEGSARQWVVCQLIYSSTCVMTISMIITKTRTPMFRIGLMIMMMMRMIRIGVIKMMIRIIRIGLG